MKYKEKSKLWYGVIKDIAKNKGFNFNSYFIYKEKNGFLFDASFYVSLKEDAIFGYLSFKPTYIDDTFWDITDLIENKKRPLSFRISAAFHVKGLTLYHYDIKIEDVFNPFPEINKLLNEIESKIEKQLQKVSDIDSYLKELLNDEAVNYIGVITILIHQKEYKTALEKIKQYKRDEDIHIHYNFHLITNDGVEIEKSFLELAEAFCYKQLSTNN